MNVRVVMSSEGQIVVPKEIRDAHGWSAGTQLELVDDGTKVEVRQAQSADPRFPSISVEEFLAKRPKLSGPPITDQDIREAVLEEAGRRFDAKSY
jgi:AbrB family looped-hinge helix DNA binding protein